jgi:hypothetical protein
MASLEQYQIFSLAMGNRRNKFKYPSQGLYIVGEGITEKCYFEHLKSIYKFNCIVRPRFFTNNCISKLEKEIENLLRGDIYIICVFDEDVSNRDSAENEKLVNLKKKYKDNKNVLFCESMPSIEYWFLIHFKDTCPNFTYSHEATKALRKYISNYEKTEDFLEKEKWVQDMSTKKGDMNKAITISKKYRNSSASRTKIYKAIEKLRKTLK